MSLLSKDLCRKTDLRTAFLSFRASLFCGFMSFPTPNLYKQSCVNCIISLCTMFLSAWDKRSWPLSHLKKPGVTLMTCLSYLQCSSGKKIYIRSQRASTFPHRIHKYDDALSTDLCQYGWGGGEGDTGETDWHLRRQRGFLKKETGSVSVQIKSYLILCKSLSLSIEYCICL